MLWVSVKLGLRMKTYFFLLFNIVVIFLSESYIFSNTISPYWQVHWFQANSGLHGNSVNIHMYMYVCMYVYSEFSCYHHTIAGNTTSNRFGVRYTASKNDVFSFRKLCFQQYHLILLPNALVSVKFGVNMTHWKMRHFGSQNFCFHSFQCSL